MTGEDNANKTQPQIVKPYNKEKPPVGGLFYFERFLRGGGRAFFLPAAG